MELGKNGPCDNALCLRLIAEGADIEMKGRHGWTALTFAARCGDIEIMRALLDKGADPDTRCDEGRTPLIWGYSKVEVLHALLDHGADVNAKNEEGVTCLMRAVVSGHDSVVPILIDGGADISAQDNKGRMAFHYARSEQTKSLLLKETGRVFSDAADRGTRKKRTIRRAVTPSKQNGM